MKATALEFKLRLWIFLAIYVLGFWAPWDRVLHLDGAGPNAHVWGVLSAEIAKTGAMSFTSAFNLVLALAIVCALAGAWVRTWGAAWLGYSVVHDRGLRSDTVTAAGPFRYVRNPLYLGTWLNTLALATLMQPSGALFTVVLVAAFELRLVLAEEAHLAAELGAPYAAYCARVPRVVPALRPRVEQAATGRPEWGRAFVTEIYMWGSAMVFAAVGWRYNALLLLQGVLVSLGLSLVVKGWLGTRTKTAHA